MSLKNQSGLTPEILNVYEHLPGMYLILEKDLKMITASNSYLRVTGKNRNEIKGKFIFDIFPVDPSAGISDSLKHVISTKQAHQIPVVRFDTPSLTNPSEMVEHHWHTSHTPILNTDGEIAYIIHFTQNVSELVATQKGFLKSADELLILNEDLAKANRETQAANEELITINNELYDVQASLKLLNLELEERVLARTAELREARAEAEKQRDRLERFFSQSPAGICVLDGPDFVYELVNKEYQELFPDRDLLHKPLLKALPEIANTPIIEILTEVYRTGKTFEADAMLVPLAKYDDGIIAERYFDFIYQARLDQFQQIDGILVFVFEVTKAVLAQYELQKSEKHRDFLLNAMPQQVWTAQADGVLNYVNNVVCADFGESAEEIVGSGWQKFIHPDDVENCLVIWTKSINTREEYLVEFRLLMKNGEYLWHLGRAIPLIEDGQVKLWVGTNTNIDLQKNNEQKKDEFISIASHELKTPLTSIKAFTQLMQRTVEPEKMSGFLKKSQENILRLEKLINDLLDVTKINAGKMVYTMQDFSFNQMLKESVEGVQYIAPAHQIILEIDQDVIFKGDRFRIEQVMNNFLTNSVKYAPEGRKIIVNSKLEQNSIVVAVQDFGIGIAQHDLNRLSERYYRVDNAAMQFEGLGLGLFISSEILKRHNGSFWIESEVGKGSTFYFRLPFSPADFPNF